MSSRITTSFLLDPDPAEVKTPARAARRSESDAGTTSFHLTLAWLQRAVRASALAPVSDETSVPCLASAEPVQALSDSDTKPAGTSCRPEEDNEDNSLCIGACHKCRRRPSKC